MMRFTDIRHTLRHDPVIGQEKERAMRLETGGGSTYVALVLALTAAIMSVPGKADETCHLLQSLLSATAPAAAIIAGAMNDDSRTFAAP